jgi:hypothetical protein
LSRWVTEAWRWVADAEEDFRVVQDLWLLSIMQQAVSIRSRRVRRLLKLTSRERVIEAVKG